MTKQDEFLTAAARLANVALALGGVLTLSVFIYLVYHFGWSADRQFSSLSFGMLYYGVPLALAVLLLSSLTFHPIHRARLLVVLVSTTASVYGLELFARSSSLYGSPTKGVMRLLEDSNHKTTDAAELTRAWGLEIDTRTASQVIADLRHTGIDAVPIMTASYHLPDGRLKSALKVDGREVMPLAGVSNKVTLLCNENGQWINYQSDGHGFNNSSEIWQSDRLEIAALGDSFTQGYCVPAEKNFVALIRQRHPATLNLGVAGDGPLLMLATLKEYLPRFKPKIVLWFYFEGNDLTDLQGERKSALLRNYLKDGFRQTALARQNDVDRAIMDEIPRLSALQRYNWTRRQDKHVIDELVDFTKLSVLRQRLGLVGGIDRDEREMRADFQGPNMDAFRDVLLQAQARVDAWGGQLLVVYLPDWARYTTHWSPGKTKRNEVLTLVHNLRIPIVDIEPAFQAHGDPLSLFPFRRPGHYNEMGHQLVADAVLKALSQRH